MLVFVCCCRHYYCLLHPIRYTCIYKLIAEDAHSKNNIIMLNQCSAYILMYISIYETCLLPKLYMRKYNLCASMCTSPYRLCLVPLFAAPYFVFFFLSHRRNMYLRFERINAYEINVCIQSSPLLLSP